MNDSERFFTERPAAVATGSTTACRTSSRCPRVEYQNLRRVRYNAFYVQDQSTCGRLTLQGALRYDHAWSYFPDPADRAGPLRAGAALVFERQDGVKGFDDISPRIGAAYDLFGHGRTSIKANLGRYLYPANNGGRFSVSHPLDPHGHDHHPIVD